MYRLTLLISFIATAALAGSVGSYGGCKSLKGERAACEACLSGGDFYQPGTGCGSTAGMHKSKAANSYKPPPKLTAMPATQKNYVTIKPGTFAIGAKNSDADKDSMKDVFDEPKVTITRPFMMKTTEVTHGEYSFVHKLSPSFDKACGMECAVNGVSWRDAIDYLNGLSKKEGLEQCYVVKGDAVT
ncbi:MAG: hypothetical protein ACO1OB_21015 [Archangium sp.]